MVLWRIHTYQDCKSFTTQGCFELNKNRHSSDLEGLFLWSWQVKGEICSIRSLAGNEVADSALGIGDVWLATIRLTQ